MTAQDPDGITAALHRRLAVSLFNRSWQLLRAGGRTAPEEDELIHTAHASAYHWRLAGGTPANLARGENQCARVYAALGRGEAAVHHGTRCLELVEAGGEGLEDWDLASALEVLARAHVAAGNEAVAKELAARAVDALNAVSDPEDRAVIAGQLAELDLGSDIQGLA